LRYRLALGEPSFGKSFAVTALSYFRAPLSLAAELVLMQWKAFGRYRSGRFPIFKRLVIALRRHILTLVGPSFRLMAYSQHT
jgi:hypothetical protein